MNQAKRQLLITALICRPEEHNIQLADARSVGFSISQRSDWFWHLLLSAMSTMGNSRGHVGLILNETNYQLVSYSNFLALNAEQRISNLTQAFKQAKIRRYSFKVKWINNNFNFIQDFGGLDTVQNLLIQLKGRESKIRLVKLFDGIGDKYARNIFMELNHPDFINSIAIDERIKDISEELEVDGKSLSYIEHEALFVSMAKDAQLTPWEMDRLLYFFKPYYLKAMQNGV